MCNTVFCSFRILELKVSLTFKKNVPNKIVMVSSLPRNQSSILEWISIRRYLYIYTITCVSFREPPPTTVDPPLRKSMKTNIDQQRSKSPLINEDKNKSEESFNIDIIVKGFQYRRSLFYNK